MTEFIDTIIVVDHYPKIRGHLGKWNDRWALCCPRCGLSALLDGHAVTINEDGTATVTQSVECGETIKCGFHFNITNSKVIPL